MMVTVRECIMSVRVFTNIEVQLFVCVYSFAVSVYLCYHMVKATLLRFTSDL